MGGQVNVRLTARVGVVVVSILTELGVRMRSRRRRRGEGVEVKFNFFCRQSQGN